MSVLLNGPVSGHIEHVQLCGLWQLWRNPRQSVLSYTEDIQAIAAPDLDNRGDYMVRLHVSRSTSVLWSIKTQYRQV